MEEKTYVNDIDRSIYDIRNEETDAYRIEEGLKPAIVEQISKERSALDGAVPAKVPADLQQHGSSRLGAFPGGTGYEPYRYLCAARHKDENEMVRCAGGHKGYL